MYRNSSDFLDYDIEKDIDPKLKFNSLLSATISTIMCLSAKCPIPKSNVETTKLFLSTITNENGERPRNIKVMIELLNKYSGPYDSDGSKESPPVENLATTEREHLSIDYEPAPKEAEGKGQVISRESHSVIDTQPPNKRNQRGNLRRSEKEGKKLIKSYSSKITVPHQILSNK